MKWFANYANYRDSVELFAVINYDGQKRSILKPMQMVLETQEGYLPSEPSLTLDGTSANSLMQALWDAGIRPNNGEGMGAEANALRSHIKFAERVADGLLARIPGSGRGQQE